MNNTLRTILIMAVVLVLGIGLFYGGMAYTRMSTWYGAYGPGGMMGGNGYGGMMGGYGSLDGVTPLSVEEARQAVESYLSSFGNEDLAIEEIMTFDNNAYAIVVEESTGVGAFELLVNPVTKAVFPEYGPNMMWNLKYGMHALSGVEGMSGFGGYGMLGAGMMMGGGYGPGGMMDGFGFSNDAQVLDVSSDMPVNAEEAAEGAQSYLDIYYPGVEVSDEITAFYGYYTLDIEKDGDIIGMLSVNGYTRQVLPHTWHGTFIEMSE